MSLPKRDGVHDRYYLIHKPDTSPEVLAEADLCIQDVLNGTARENHSAYPTVVRNHNGTPFLPSQLLDRYLSKLPLKGFPYEEAVIFCDALRRLVGWKEIDYTLEQYIKKQVQERYFEAGEKEDDFTPYAQRWAELDPEDEDAVTVIQECQKEIAKRAEAETEDESDHTGVFTGFVLLSKAEWDKEQFIRDMKEKWDIPVEEYDESEEKDDALVFEVGDMLAAVSLASYPIPGGEAEGNAENNYMWEDAVKVAKEHCAHLMVAVLGKEEDLLEKGKLYTKLVATCCRQKYATGIYTSGVVFEPRFYEGFADMMRSGDLPIFNWIWFGLWRDEHGMNGYTMPMNRTR